MAWDVLLIVEGVSHCTGGHRHIQKGIPQPVSIIPDREYPEQLNLAMAYQVQMRTEVSHS